MPISRPRRGKAKATLTSAATARPATDRRASAAAPLSSIGNVLTRAFERMSIVVDDIVGGPLCSSSPSSKVRGDGDDAANLSGATADASMTSFVVAHVADSDLVDAPPDGPGTSNVNVDAALPNFASWLSSQEFDASAIVWNGDDEDPRELPREEFVEGEKEEGEKEVEKEGEESGYITISDLREGECGVRRDSPWRVPLPPVVGDALDGIISSSWKCWEIDVASGVAIGRKSGPSSSSAAAAAAVATGRTEPSGGARTMTPLIRPLMKDSSWTVDQLGVSPRRDRAMWMANRPEVDNRPAEPPESSVRSSGDDGASSSPDETGINGVRAGTSTPVMGATICRVPTTTDLSVATTLVGEDISVPATPSRYVVPAPSPRRATADDVASNSFSYSISEGTFDMRALSSNELDDDGNTPLMFEHVKRRAGEISLSNKKRWVATRMRRRSRLTAS